MQRAIIGVFVAALTASAAAQNERRPDPLEPKAKAPAPVYRSTFEGYRAFADEDLRDWRKSNDEVGAAGGHLGLRPGEGAGQQPSKPQPGKPESSGGATETPGARTQGGHGGHK